MTPENAPTAPRSQDGPTAYNPRDTERAWIDAGWWRIGGAGVSDPLWSCPVCHAATTRPDDHTQWHDNNRGAIRRARNGPGMIR